MGRGVKQKFVRQLLRLLFTVWQSYSPDKKGGPSVNWSSLGSMLLTYRDRVDLSADAKTSFNKLARVLGLKWYVLLPLYQETDNSRFYIVFANRWRALVNSVLDLRVP
jgi:hypothetical protein